MRRVDFLMMSPPHEHTRIEADGSTSVELPTIRVRLAADGIVEVRPVPGAQHGASEAREAIAITKSLLGGLDHVPVLVELRGARPVDRETRNVYANGLDFVSAQAMIVGSPVSRVMANVFLRLHRPRFPTRVFTDEIAARAWLVAGEWNAAAARTG